MSVRTPRGPFLSEFLTWQERLALGFLLGIGFLGVGVVGWRNLFPAPESFQTPLEIHANQASCAQWTALPGIGPVLAKRIVEDRQKNGRFLTLEDLRRVKGVTPKVLGRINGLVRFD